VHFKTQFSSLIAVACVVSGQVSQVQAKEIARVNDKSISEMDLAITLVGMSEMQREKILQDPVIRQRMVLQAIDQELVAQEAEKLKFNEDPRFKKELNYQRNLLLMNYFIEKKIIPQISQGEAKKFYQRNKAKFGINLVRIQQILVADEQLAKEVLAKVRAPQADFQRLAEAYSIDPTAKNNRGEVGYVAQGQVDSLLFDAAQAASVGSVVGPIRNLAGYHLIKVLDKKSGTPPEYDEIELQVKAALREELVQKYINNLRKSAKLAVNQAGLSLDSAQE
jgi:peptidyl-prolyl cis-trans isomerase C